MSTKRDSDESVQPVSDVFDMERPVREVPPRGDLDSQTGNTEPANSTFVKIVKSAKPKHFLIAGLAATLLWIAMPYFNSDTPDVAKPESRLMLPATAGAMPVVPRADTHPNPAAAESALPQTATPDMPPSAPAPQLPLPAQQPAPYVQSPPADHPVSSTRTIQPHRRMVTGSKFRHPAIETTGAASLRFSINTIYAGQAWIQDQERTYVVQTGDKVDGIEIISIDARGRRVFTSRGMIR